MQRYMIWEFQSMVVCRFTLSLPAPLPQSIPGGSGYSPGGGGNREGKGRALLNIKQF